MYAPISSDTSWTSFTGPQVTYSQGKCTELYQLCELVNDCVNKVTIPDTSCTLSNSTLTAYDTAIQYQKGSSYPNAYLYIYKPLTTQTFCSTNTVNIVYDCSLYLSGIADISSYTFVSQISIGSNLAPNNPSVAWITNTKPNFCQTTCEFIDSTTLPVAWTTTSALGSYSIPFDFSQPFTNTTGYVECTYTNATGGPSTIVQQSNAFTVTMNVACNTSESSTVLSIPTTFFLNN
jgi:hypothetical protein